MKAKKLLALLLTLCMLFSLLPAVYAAPADPYSVADAKISTLKITLDGKATTVKEYVDLYYPEAEAEDQIVTVYVPENATPASPVIYMVNNGGWFMNQAAKAYKVKDGGNYVSTSDKDVVGKALAEGYVILSAGSRNRMMPGIGHSPATMVDYKAAIRWFNYNAEAIGAGNPERIVATGTSGGGALSTVLAASGNSSDYLPYLYEAGAYGVDYVDGKYVDTSSDAVWAVIGYCPITDLGNACAAYDWQWGATRFAQIEDGTIEYTVPTELQKEASAVLVAEYEKYIDSIGIEEISSANMEATIIALMKAEIEETIKEIGIEQMKKDLGGADWLIFNDDGSYTYDYEKHLYWVGTQSTFKPASAFSNVGMSAWAGSMNEDNLFGEAEDIYCPFNAYSWANDDTPDNGVGQDDTGLTWEEFLATEKGELLKLQARMTSSVNYLLDTEDDADTAPYWYVRYGMADRDSSFAVEATLNAAMKNDPSIEDVDFEYAWLEGHGGDYDVQEAYAWLADKLDAFSVEGAEETNSFNVKLDGETLGITRYNDYYYSDAEGDTTSIGPGKYGPAGDRDDCQLSIYVPEGADSTSAVMFLIENGSWAQTGFKEVISAGQSFDSTQNDRVALALAHNMIVVTYGARCRGSVDAEGNHIHAPQMVVDTKAAIRYVKYNIEQGYIPGDADKVIISGHSGGGALTAVIAATGNAPDYEAYLVNAAPATDDVLATMSSAPITDLAYADFAYEWTFSDYRDEAPYDKLSYGEYDADMKALSDTLAAKYAEYIKDAFGLSEEEYTAKIAEIFAASVQHEIDLADEFQYGDIRPETDERGWFELDENGDVASFDLEAYTAWAVQNAGITGAYKGNELKGIMAFNSEGMKNGYNRNENNLWGTAEQPYSIAYPELWNMVKDPTAIGVDKYGSWNAFWKAEGETVAKQMKSVSVMPYLVGSDTVWYLDGVKTSDESDVAPYWFIRHGMGDIDTSYATVASLMLAVEEKAEDVNAYFGWERGHNGGGNTYYLEFFQWIEEKGIVADPDMEVQVSTQKITVAGEAVDAEIYNINGYNYFKLRDVAMLLKGSDAEFGVDFDGAKKEVYIDTDGKYEAVGGELDKAGDKSATCVLSAFDIYVNGQLVRVAVYNIGGNNYFKLRDLGDAIGFDVDYDEPTRTIEIL